MMIKYFEDELHMPSSRLTLERFNRDFVLGFLKYLEIERNAGNCTINQRLSAIHAFCKYLQTEEPTYIFEYQRILAIPYKKYAKPMIEYLSKDALKAILGAINTNKRQGRRDLTLLSVLYDTGARVQELCDLKIRDLFLEEKPYITLTGKGRKTRGVVLMDNTSEMLKWYINEFHCSVIANDDSPLFYTLQNLDTSRLSVITCDPAALRRLAGTEVSGTPVDYLEEILQERGIFDQGLVVGLYVMQLDYMGQMTSFGAADFAEPLLWGRPDYAETRATQGAMPMPRLLLVLVVGQPAQVRAYTEKWNSLLDQDEKLQETRGPEKGQLCYTANGETVTQQPFAFFYEYTDIQRPSAGLYTQREEGFAVQAESGAVSRENGLYTVRLTGREGSASLTLRWPLQQMEGAETLDLSQLTEKSVRVIDSLLLDSVLPNTPETAMESGADRQALTLRDKQYVFVRQENPFDDAPEQSPFALTGLRWNEENHCLEAELQVEREKLKSGYYRLEVEAELSGRQILWPKVEWEKRLGTEITNSQISTWESFTQHLYRCGRRLKNVPKQFDHAWGPATSKPYQDVTIPDFPPVYRALHLQSLLEQLREGANVENVPLIRCVLDVFVADVPNP